MAIGTHKVPKETKNATTKWAKYFSTGQLMAMVGQIVIDYGIFRFFENLGIHWVGIFIDLAITAVVGIIVMGTMPPSKYLLGSGLPFWKILFRMIIHRIKHKYIYIRNYGGVEIEDKDVQEGGILWALSRLFPNM